MLRGKKKRRKMGDIDYGIFYTVVILLAIGVIMVYSASSYFAMIHDKNHNSAAFLIKQAFSAVLGVGMMFVVVNIDYHKLKKITPILMGITVPLLLVVRLFPAVNGAQRWIPLGPLSFQPSELAKYVVVFFLAMVLSNKGDEIKKFKMVVIYFGIAGFYAGLVLAQKNLSVASIIMIVSFIMIFAAGARWQDMFLKVAPVLAAGAAIFAFFEPYRRARMLNFLDPWKDAAGDGYQLIQSFYSLGAGGITGLGLGQSRQKALYMPEPHNDFIFAIIGEELGLIGCCVIIALFLILIWRGYKVAMEAKDTYGSLMALGITSVIAVQCLINIAVVTGSMPVTGVPLPFISYGGTSLLITMMAIGILLNISRQRKTSENN